MTSVEFQDTEPCPCAEGLRGPLEAAPAHEQPDLRLGIVGPGDELRAHAGLWWSEAPRLPGERVACVGGFEAADAASARQLLDAACVRLGAVGCTLVVGPMNGNTWRQYRCVVEGGVLPPFFLEPWNVAELPGWWQGAGFGHFSGYTSSRLDLDRDDIRDYRRVRDRLDAAGVVIRGVRIDDYEEELGAIHRLSLEAFADNVLYTPLSEDEFVGMYGKVRDFVRPEFVRIAEVEGEVAGFVFALPDVLAIGRGEAPGLIVKTLAVRAERRMAGLGSVLVDEVQEAARAAGYRHVIHALAQDSNTSRRITRREGGKVMRRYALFSRMP